LIRLPGIGGKRAKKLRDKGFESISDIADPKRKRDLVKIFPVPFAVKLQRDAQLIENRV